MAIAYDYGTGYGSRRGGRPRQSPLPAVCPADPEDLATFDVNTGTQFEPTVVSGQADPCGGTAAAIVTDTTTGQFQGLAKRYTVTASTSDYQFRLFVKKDPTANHFAEFQYRFGGATVSAAVQLNPATGAFHVRQGTAAVTALEELSGWWTVTMTAANIGATVIEINIWPAVGSAFGELVPSSSGAITIFGVSFGEIVASVPPSAMCPDNPEDLASFDVFAGTPSQAALSIGEADPCGGTAAALLSDTDAAEFRGIAKRFTVPADTSHYSFGLFVRKDASATEVAEFQYRFGVFGSVSVGVQFDPANGTFFVRTGSAEFTVSEDIPGWWTVTMTAANTGATVVEIDIWPSLGGAFGALTKASSGTITVYGVTFGQARQFRHIVYYGQSNAVPRGGLITSGLAASIGHSTFNGGLQPTFTQAADWASDAGLAVDAGNLASLTPLEPATMGLEGFAYAVAETLGAGDVEMVHTALGVNGTVYAGLKKTTVPYANVLMANGALPDGRTESTIMLFVHGESDRDSATYGSDLAALAADLAADIANFRLFITQMVNWTKLSGAGTSLPPSAKAQLAFAEAGNAELLCPVYHLPFSDGLHFSAYGNRWIGEKFAQAIVTGTGTWQSLRPAAITASGSTITVALAGRTGALQFNVYDAAGNPNGVADPGDYGFSLDDPGGAVITGVAIVDDTVEITTDQPVSAGAELGYANRVASVPVDSGHLTGPRGCLSDSDPLPPSETLAAYRRDVLGQSAAQAAAPLVNWCVAFEKPVAIA